MYLIKKEYILILLLIITGCSFRPQIVRDLIPVDKNIKTANNIIIAKQQDIIISLRYINKDEFWKILREQDNKFLASIDAPTFSVFKIKIENSSENKIEFDPSKSFLYCNDGKKESYVKKKFIKQFTRYQATPINFLFNFKKIDIINYLNSSSYIYSIGEAGSIYPLFQLEGLLIFDRIPEDSKEIVLDIQGIKLGDETIPAKYNYTQKIKRLNGM